MKVRLLVSKFLVIHDFKEQKHRCFERELKFNSKILSRRKRKPGYDFRNEKLLTPGLLHSGHGAIHVIWRPQRPFPKDAEAKLALSTELPLCAPPRSHVSPSPRAHQMFCGRNEELRTGTQGHLTPTSTSIVSNATKYKLSNFAPRSTQKLSRILLLFISYISSS